MRSRFCRVDLVFWLKIQDDYQAFDQTLSNIFQPHGGAFWAAKVQSICILLSTHMQRLQLPVFMCFRITHRLAQSRCEQRFEGATKTGYSARWVTLKITQVRVCKYCGSIDQLPSFVLYYRLQRCHRLGCWRASGLVRSRAPLEHSPSSEH